MRVLHNRERHLRGGYTVIGGIALPCFCSNMKLQAIATKMPQELRQDMLFMYVCVALPAAAAAIILGARL